MYPMRLIASNAGINGSVVLERVINSPDPNFGYNAATGRPLPILSVHSSYPPPRHPTPVEPMLCFLGGGSRGEAGPGTHSHGCRHPTTVRRPALFA